MDLSLCEHILPIYQNELKSGNRPLFVSTPCYVDKHASAEIVIYMRQKMKEYSRDGLQKCEDSDHHFPRGCGYKCTACKQSLLGPLETDQQSWYAYDRWHEPNADILATEDGILIKAGARGQFMVPTVCLEDHEASGKDGTAPSHLLRAFFRSEKFPLVEQYVQKAFPNVNFVLRCACDADYYIIFRSQSEMEDALQSNLVGRIRESVTDACRAYDESGIFANLHAVPMVTSYEQLVKSGKTVEIEKNNPQFHLWF